MESCGGVDCKPFPAANVTLRPWLAEMRFVQAAEALKERDVRDIHKIPLNSSEQAQSNRRGILLGFCAVNLSYNAIYVRALLCQAYRTTNYGLWSTINNPNNSWLRCQ